MPTLITLAIGLLALVLAAGCAPDNGIVPLDRPGADGVAADRQSVSEEGGTDGTGGCEEEEDDDTGEIEDEEEEDEHEEDCDDDDEDDDEDEDEDDDEDDDEDEDEDEDDEDDD